MRAAPLTIAPTLLALACQSTPAQPQRPATKAASATRAAEAAPSAPTPAASPSSAAPAAPDPAQLPSLMSTIPGDGPLVATLRTSLGELRCRIEAQAAPRAATSFIALALGKTPWLDHETGLRSQPRPFYDRTIFHRALPDLFVQAGDRSGTGRHGPGWDLPVERGLPHDRAGLLIQARAGSRSSGSQFLIAAAALPHLEPDHTAFGVCAPIALIQRMTRVPTDASDRPINPPQLLAITLSRGSAL